VKFFEPDVYVEAAEGLLESIGLKNFRTQHAFEPLVINLDEFFQKKNGRAWAEPSFSLNIYDALAHIYKTEQQFVRRDKREAIRVTPQRGTALVEAIFGVYPEQPECSYFQDAYEDCYKPETVKGSTEAWIKTFLHGADTPLRVTAYTLDRQGFRYHNPVLFIFDPTRATDLIDFWNMRLEPYPVLPVPKDWFVSLRDQIYDLLKAQHRPVVGNPHGIMHHATVEFARSIPHQEAQQLIQTLKPGLPAGALSVKYWRNSVWVEQQNDSVHRDLPMRVTSAEKRATLTVKESRG
jgi:hypothetical protein